MKDSEDARAAESESPHNGGIMVLMVEGGPAVHEAVRAALPKACRIMSARRGEDLMAKVEAYGPDLIIMEARPEEGISLARRLSARPELGRIPVLLLAATNGRASPPRLLDAPGIAYLSTPFEPKAFSDAVARLTGNWPWTGDWAWRW